MIPLRWKLYAILGVAFVLGLLRVRAQWLTQGEEKLRAELDSSRLEAINRSKEIRNEVEILDDVGLADRARKWVRGDGR